MLAIKIDAGHDRNGNPKRGWIIANDDGDFVDFVDEGYEGSAALARSQYARITQTTQALQVAPGVYKKAYNQSYGSRRHRG